MLRAISRRGRAKAQLGGQVRYPCCHADVRMDYSRGTLLDAARVMRSSISVTEDVRWVRSLVDTLAEELRHLPRGYVRLRHHSAIGPWFGRLFESRKAISREMIRPRGNHHRA